MQKITQKETKKEETPGKKVSSISFITDLIFEYYSECLD